MMNRFIVLAGVVVLGACGFEKSLPGDASGPAVRVGFVAGASTADEKSSMFPITVKLSDVTDHDVTVKYQVEPGVDVDPSDFDLVTPETFTIPAGQLTADLFIKIKADTKEEGDEYLGLTLLDPVGAEIELAASRHDVTIRARALPRVSFEQAGSSAQEPSDATFNAVLDEESEFEIVATYTVTSTNATSGMDYVLADGMVTFTPGIKIVPIVLDVLDDALDEDNEDVVVTLTTSTNSLVDNLADKHTHTILDDLVDPPPTVQFAAPTSTHGEAAGAVTIAVSLSAASGRSISVPYAIDAANSTATGGGADFTLAASPLVIPAGQLGGTIAVTIVQDTTDEPDETFEVDMGAATNATNTGTQNHRLQINDDDQICYGTAPYAVCLDAPPQGAQVLPATINTGSSGLCAATQPTNWTTAPQSQPAACFILRDTISVTGTVTVQGNRPLVLVAASGITISAKLDASSNNVAGSTGPASPSTADCGGLVQIPDRSATGGGGGAGGSFMTKGGDGGTGNNGNTAAGEAAAASGTPTKLRAGCNGQRGGSGSNMGGTNPSGDFGRGGGVLYLVTGGTLTLGASAVIDVSGSAGNGGAVFSGASGAGSGGMVRLFANTLAATAGAVILANGGGGASGGDNTTGGTAGQDPDPATPLTPAGGGTGGGGASGGAGHAGATVALKGDDAVANEGGGGGGGGGGLIQTNNALTNVTASAGVIQAP